MNTKHILSAFLSVCLIASLFSCDEAEVVSYSEYDLSYEMDTTLFLNTGEERMISLKFARRKAVDHIQTDTWEEIPSSSVSVSSQNGTFRIQFDTGEQAIKVSTAENLTDRIQTDSLFVTVNEHGFHQTITIPLRQEASRISYDYKILSEQNPFTVPRAGGQFFIPFTCMCQKTINGKKGDWEYADMRRLRYETVHSSRIHCEASIETDGETGHYKFHITVAEPFEIVEGKQPVWYYVIRTQLFEETQVKYLKQSFVPENFDPAGDYDTGALLGESGSIEI